MKIALWMIGKTDLEYLKAGMQIYEKRLERYFPFEKLTLPDVKRSKKSSPSYVKEAESKLILSKLQSGDALVLLDERGRTFSSTDFAQYMEQQLYQSHRRLIFLIGGAYGFSDEVYKRAIQKISLSKMTFSHQMVRLIFLEQLYRAMSILNNEPYHHE
ncbi:MAG: 23S rRNA (pseudouridine(1915)-N(3))-methyltransferase RlmH [Bacteroidota bacterium]